MHSKQVCLDCHLSILTIVFARIICLSSYPNIWRRKNKGLFHLFSHLAPSLEFPAVSYNRGLARAVDEAGSTRMVREARRGRVAFTALTVSPGSPLGTAAVGALRRPATWLHRSKAPTEHPSPPRHPVLLSYCVRGWRVLGESYASIQSVLSSAKMTTIFVYD